MTSVTSIIGSAPGVITPPVPAVSPVTPPDTAPKLAPQAHAATFTERQIDDPLSGVVITQYLNSQDHVITQVPPSAVVAYLQDGLTADGEPKSPSKIA
jgi:hypothetical protein